MGFWGFVLLFCGFAVLGFRVQGLEALIRKPKLIARDLLPNPFFGNPHSTACVEAPYAFTGA